MGSQQESCAGASIPEPVSSTKLNLSFLARSDVHVSIHLREVQHTCPDI